MTTKETPDTKEEALKKIVNGLATGRSTHFLTDMLETVVLSLIHI